MRGHIDANDPQPKSDEGPPTRILRCRLRRELLKTANKFLIRRVVATIRLEYTRTSQK